MAKKKKPYTNIHKEAKRMAGIFTRKSLRVEDETEKVLYTLAERIQAGAKRRAPVDKGLLRKSIAIRQEGRGKDVVFYVGTSVRYGKFIEYGTKKMKAQPFLRPAILKNRKFVLAKIAEVLREKDG